jgi:hypothetical protein
MYAINTEKAMQHEATSLQLKSARRTATLDDQFDKVMSDLHKESADRMTSITDTAQQEGMKGLVSKFGPDLKKAYPGMDIQQVGNTIVVSHGRERQVISSTDEAVAALKKAAGAEFSQKMQDRLLPLFKDAGSLAAYMKGREENDIKRQEANTHAGFYGPGGTYERVHNATIAATADAKNQGTAVGLNKDGTKMLFSTPNGLVERPVPAGYEHLFPKFTGEKKGTLNQAVDLKKNDDGTYTAFAHDGGHALYNTYNGEKLPLGMDVQAYQKMKKDATDNGVKLVSGEDDNGQLTLRYQGADGKFYQDVEKARYAKAEPAAGDEPKKEAIPTYTPPANSPAAKAAANREAKNKDRIAREKEVSEQRSKSVKQAIATSRRTDSMSATDRFEEDRKTMSKPQLRRQYGNGAGLTDEQYKFLMQ